MDLELVYRPQFLQNLLIKISLLKYYINWPNIITRLYLFPKLFRKMHFLFHAEVFDVRKFQFKILKFNYLKMEKSFWKEIKNIFLRFPRAIFLLLYLHLPKAELFFSYSAWNLILTLVVRTTPRNTSQKHSFQLLNLFFWQAM